MKQLLGILLTLAQLLCNAQDGLVFKVEYTPETTYRQTVIESSQNKTKYNGSKTFLQNLKNNGTDNPTVENNLKKTETLLTVGKVSSDGSCFPITIEFLHTESKDSKKIIPNGSLIFGYGSIGSPAVLDSIASDGLSNDLKSGMLKTMNNALSEIKYPDRELKIGESFSMENMATIPFADSKIEMGITSTYKLTSIAKGIARFDITQVHTMKRIIGKYTLNATGDGNGKIIYDIKNRFNTHYEITTNIKVTAKLDSIGFTVNSQSKFVQDNTITKSVSPTTVFVSCEHMKQKPGNVATKHHFQGTDTIINNEKRKFYTLLNEDGSMLETGYYISDSIRLLDGVVIQYYKNGNKSSQVNYKLGLPDGDYIFYHDNGNLWSLAKFSRGKPEEIISNFDRNGKQKDKGTLKNGNGTIIRYDEGGNQTFVDEYKNGDQVKPK